MVSDLLASALEAEIVGQPSAIQAAVRGTVHVMSGLTPRERKWSAFLFVGPGGTGKTQLVQSLARILHGDNRGLYSADCTLMGPADPWTSFALQVMPMFSIPRLDLGGLGLEAPPMSILLIEYLERGQREVWRALASAFETGRVALPGGRFGSLRNCLVFATTGLCSRELLEEVPRIGFAGTPQGDEEEGRIHRASVEHAAQQFGEDLVSRLDGVVVFHKLDAAHLSLLLERRFARLARALASRGFRASLSPAAHAFLLERGRGEPTTGARELVRAHRRFVEFPLADLFLSGRIPSGGLVTLDRKEGEDHLHFTVTGAALAPPGGTEVPIAWEPAQA